MQRVSAVKARSEQGDEMIKAIVPCFNVAEGQDRTAPAGRGLQRMFPEFF